MMGDDVPEQRTSNTDIGWWERRRERNRARREPGVELKSWWEMRRERRREGREPKYIELVGREIPLN